ncbi:MAG TPA: hypothetical protein VJ740_10505 [Hyphomicrobiaceae bacterium]|nr:hypothetical protein [Hyphomicrobiaceae bacterium]
MRSGYSGILGVLTALVSSVSLAGPSEPFVQRTQLAPPFGVPTPLPPGFRGCSQQHQRLLKLQMDAMRQLQRLSKGDGERLCTSLESVDQKGVARLLDPKALEPLLTPDQRDLLSALGIDLSKVDVPRLMQRLGIDLSQVDLRQLSQQCRQSKGDIENFTSREIARLEGEMVRCDDRI